MGCGTGRLDKEETFRIKLRFKPRIPPTHPVYTNFESAVRGFLGAKLEPKGWTPGMSGGKVDTVKIEMHGPIDTEPEQKQFNRAMNRLLWGVRFACPGDVATDPPRPSHFEVNVVELQKGGGPVTGPDWTFEDTCKLPQEGSVGKARRKRKAPRKR